MDTGRVRVAYRHMLVVGPESLLAAEASECAGDQGQFAAYHDLLFQNQGPENEGYITTDLLGGFAEQLGLDPEQFAQCLDSDKYRDLVIQATAEGRTIGVPGTPTVLVNGRLIADPLDVDLLRSIILDELERNP